MISTRRSQIRSWYNWYKAAKWYQKASRYAKYVYEKTWREADIAARYVKIGSYEASIAVANLSLDAAQLVLSGLEAGAVYTPIDLDPRVSSLIVAKETALLALKVAELPFANVPVIDHDFEGRIELQLDIYGLSGTVTATFDGYDALNGWLEFDTSPKACINIEGMGEACTKF